MRYRLCKRWQLLYWSNRKIAPYIGIAMIEARWRLLITRLTLARSTCVTSTMICCCSDVCLCISQLIRCLLATFKRADTREAGESKQRTEGAKKNNRVLRNETTSASRLLLSLLSSRQPDEHSLSLVDRSVWLTRVVCLPSQFDARAVARPDISINEYRKLSYEKTSALVASLALCFSLSSARRRRRKK